jgi:hypothetical protein
MNMIKLSVLKNRLSGILSVGYSNISVVSGILSVGHPSFSVVSGILSVVGIPPVPIPIPEEIQLLMYGHKRSFKRTTHFE